MPYIPKIRVLVLEDNTQHASALCFALNALVDMEAEAASSIESACRKLMEERFDVLLLDPSVEGNKGEEIFYFLEISDAFSPSKILVMSHIPGGFEESMFRAKAFAVLKRPLDVHELVEVILR